MFFSTTDFWENTNMNADSGSSSSSTSSSGSESSASRGSKRSIRNRPAATGEKNSKTGRSGEKVIIKKALPRDELLCEVIM